jgi:transcriptional regulator with XRE-family HTH domain
MIAAMERLKRWLSDTSTSQTALSETLKVSQPTVSAWISGEFSPSIKNLHKLSDVTGLSIDELLDAPKQKPDQHHRPAA